MYPATATRRPSASRSHEQSAIAVPARQDSTESCDSAPSGAEEWRLPEPSPLHLTLPRAQSTVNCHRALPWPVKLKLQIRNQPANHLGPDGRSPCDVPRTGRTEVVAQPNGAGTKRMAGPTNGQASPPAPDPVYAVDQGAGDQTSGAGVQHVSDPQ
jgi:hypothetical protein